MKLKKVLFLFFTVFVLLMCGFTVKTAASSSVTLTITGAGIRTTGNAGIRFIAQIGEGESFPEGSIHGFYVAKGDHSYNDIVDSINNGVSTVNGKNLLQTTVSGSGSVFSVAIVDIDTGVDEDDIERFTSDLTVLPFIKLSDGSYIFSEDSCTRNIGWIAKMNSNNSSELVQRINNLVGGQYIDLSEEVLSRNPNIYVGENLTVERSKYFINGKYQEGFSVYNTLSEATAAAAEGSIIYASDSTFSGEVVINKSDVTIIGSNMIVEDTFIIDEGLSGVVIEGITFNTGITGTTATDLTIESCTFNASNITITTITNITVNNSSFNGDGINDAINITNCNGSIILYNNRFNEYVDALYVHELGVPNKDVDIISITYNVYTNISQRAINLYGHNEGHTNDSYIYKQVVINNNIFKDTLKAMWYGAIDNDNATFNNNILYYSAGGYAVRGFYAEQIDCSNNLYLDGETVVSPNQFSFAGTDGISYNVSKNKDVYYDSIEAYFIAMLGITFDSVEVNYDGNEHITEVAYTNTEHCEVTSVTYENNSRILPGVSNAVATITVDYNEIEYVFALETTIIINRVDYSSILVDSSYSELSIGTEVADGYIYGVNAFSTFTEALEVVSENGTITVNEGTYSESSIVNKSNVTFIGTNAVLSNAVKLSDGVSGVRFEGFTFNSGIIGTTVGDLIIENCTFSGTSSVNSINITTSTGIIDITNSTFDTALNAIYVNAISGVSSSTDYINISNNIFIDMADIAVNLFSSATTAVDCTYQDVTINNNIFECVYKAMWYGNIDNCNATFSYNMINCTGTYIVRGTQNTNPIDCRNNIYLDSSRNVVAYDSSKFNTTNNPNVAVNGSLCYGSISEYFTAILDMTFDNVEVNYDGNEHIAEVIYTEIANCVVLIAYQNNSRTEVGTTKALATITIDYMGYTYEYEMISYIIIKDNYDAVVDDDYSVLTSGDETIDGYVYGETAFSTITEALSVIGGNGGVIRVYDGTYSKSLIVNKSNVTFIGTNVVLSSVVTLSDGVSGVRFEGFIFNGGIIGTTASNLTIENCTFNASNITITTLTNITVNNSSFNGSGIGSAINVTNNCGSLVFFNNVIDNYKHGIFTSNLSVTASNTHKIVITNNTFSNITGIAIDLDDAEHSSGLLYTEVLINNNIFKNVAKVMWYGGIANNDATFNNNIIYFVNADTKNYYVVKGGNSTAIDCRHNLFLTTDGSDLKSVSAFGFNNAATSQENCYTTINAYYEANGKLDVSVDSDRLALNEELQINVTYTGEGIISYESSDLGVAIVDQNGVVSSISEGEVVITVTLTTANGVCVYEVYLEVYNHEDEASELLALLAEYNETSAFNGKVSYYTVNSPTSWTAISTSMVYGSVNGYYPGTLPSIDTTYNMGVATTNTKGCECSGGPRSGNVEFITFHDTGGAGASQNAAWTASYLKTQTDTEKGWHYTVDDSSIYQSLDESVMAYHAGDGSKETTLKPTGIKVTNVNHRPVVTIGSDGYFYLDGVKSTLTVASNMYSGAAPTSSSTLPTLGIPAVIKDGYYYIPNIYYNASYGSYGMQGGGSSIAIESCVDSGSDLYLTWHYSAKFIASLLVKYNLTPDRVVFHNNFSNKMCPNTMMNANLVDKFLNLVYAEYYVAKNFSGWTITFSSGNTNLVDNNGRIVTKVTTTTQVPYTITVSNGDTTKSIDLVAIIQGTNS